MSTRFVMLGTVRAVEERVARRWLRGAGEAAEFLEESEGWYAVLGEWPISVYLGKTRVGLRAGDSVRLTLEKM